MFRRFALLFLPILAVFAGLAVVSSPASAEPRLSARAMTAAKPTPRTVTVVLRDCGDIDGDQRCVTADEGAWRLVTSWTPYRSVKTRVCKSAATKLPCFKRAGAKYRVRMAR